MNRRLDCVDKTILGAPERKPTPVDFLDALSGPEIQVASGRDPRSGETIGSRGEPAPAPGREHPKSRVGRRVGAPIGFAAGRYQRTGVLPDEKERTMALRAHVHAGRLVLDEETDLPEGTVLDLVVDDDGDDLDDAERAQLHDALAESFEQMRRGETRDASEILDELRARG